MILFMDTLALSVVQFQACNFYLWVMARRRNSGKTGTLGWCLVRRHKPTLIGTLRFVRSGSNPSVLHSTTTRVPGFTLEKTTGTVMLGPRMQACEAG